MLPRVLGEEQAQGSPDEANAGGEEGKEDEKQTTEQTKKLTTANSLVNH